MMTHDSDSCRSSGPGRHRRRHGRGARKERVLHTRVSEQLSDDIRKFAEDLRVPASNLVRNVLEEVFLVVDSVSEDVGGLFDDLIEEAEGVRERVRNQAFSESGRHRRRSHSRRRRRGGSSDGTEADFAANVEDELRRDERAEAAGRGTSEEAEGDGPTAFETDRPSAGELFPDILGWQPLVLNRDLECGRCQRDLAAGDSAFLGLGERGLTKTALCGPCAGHREV